MHVAHLKAQTHHERSTTIAAQQQQQHSSGDERSTTAAAQEQQHSSGGDVGGPEEAPLVPPATLPFLVCITKSHGEAPHRGVASAQRMVEG